MSTEFEDGWSKPDFVETKQFKLLFWGGVAALISGVLYFVANKPITNPRIKVQEYVWPVGCEKKQYQNFEKISPRCLQSEYYIGDGREYNWQRSGYGKSSYYRVGNDALNVAYCDYKLPCYVRNLVKDAFVVGENR